MGAWDFGPFDNDDAADWCGALNDTPAEKRADLVERTLRIVIGETDYLDVSDGAAAIAAAAVIAADLPGAEPLTSAYAPAFLREGGRLDLPTDLTALAVQALDRVTGEDSEWVDLWLDGGSDSPALIPVRDLRARLTAH